MRTDIDETQTAIDAPPSSTTAQPRRSGIGARLVQLLEAYALLIFTIAIAVFFSLWSSTSETFPTSANLKILVSSQAIAAIVAIGLLIPLISNEFDLSVGAVVGLSAVFSASALSSGMPVILAIILGVALGALVGLVNGVLVTVFGINGVIATLGTSTLIAGAVTQKTGGLSIVSDIPASVTNFGSGATLGIPRPTWAMIVIALLTYYLLAHTPLGRYMYAFGSNRAAAALVGIRTKMILLISFVLAGTLSGAAGVLSVANSGGADPRVGPSYLLPAFAAAFLSAAAIKPGQYNIGGVIVGIFFLAVLNNGLNLAGAEPYVASYVNGAALLTGLGIAVALSRKRAR